MSACASVQQSNVAEPEQKGSNKEVSAAGLVISGEENADLSSLQFAEIDFTFENRTHDWIRIKKVTLDFGDKAINQEIQIPVGEDLVAWARAAQQLKAISDYNTSLVLGSILVAGSIAAGASNDPSVRVIGGAAALGSAGGFTALALREERRSIELAKLSYQSKWQNPTEAE
jgi:hypothetical protein